MLTPQVVVEEARDVSHPWHPEFTWDNTVAAERYRLDQARSLIARVRITVIQGRVRIASIAYVHMPGSKQQGYIPVIALRDDAAQARDAIVIELQRVQSSLRRCLSLAGTLGLTAQVERLLAEAVGLASLLDLTGDDLDAAMAA